MMKIEYVFDWYEHEAPYIEITATIQGEMFTARKMITHEDMLTHSVLDYVFDDMKEKLKLHIKSIPEIKRHRQFVAKGGLSINNGGELSMEDRRR